MTVATDTPAPQDAAPAVAPQANIDPTWHVVTTYGVIEIQATEVDLDDDCALLLLNDAAVTAENDAGIVAAVKWESLVYAFDTAYGTVIEPPVTATAGTGD